MCYGLMRLTLCLGILTTASACDGYHLPTGQSPFDRVSNSSPTPTPTPTPVPMPPGAIPRTVINVGAIIHATIGTGDPICDPVGWDARAPCRLFVLTPSRNGTLKVTVTVTSPLSVPNRDVIDVMLSADPLYPGGPSEYSADAVSAPVLEDRTYLIRINSYPYLLAPPGNLDFELKTEM